MMLVSVAMPDVEKAWCETLPLIRRIADSAPDLTLEELWRSLRSGESEMWLAGNGTEPVAAVAITRLRSWDGETVAYVLGVASNDQRAWREIIPQWRSALKARGASQIIIEGRDGWRRIFPEAVLIRQVFGVTL